MGDLPSEDVIVTGHLNQGVSFANFAHSIVGVINTAVIPLLIACAFVAFIWGVVNYFFLHADSEEGRKEGRQFIVWGILGLVIIFSIWGLVNVLLSTLQWGA